MGPTFLLVVEIYFGLQKEASFMGRNALHEVLVQNVPNFYVNSTKCSWDLPKMNENRYCGSKQLSL